MGDDAKKQREEADRNRREGMISSLEQQRTQFQQPTPFENEFAGPSQDFYNTYTQSRDRQMQDYGDIMQGFRDYRAGPVNDLMKATAARKAPNFSFERVSPERVAYKRTAETDEGLGNLRTAFGTTSSALPGYQEFSQTGGYSPQDIQELRARGVSPIRSAYSNTMRELDRARSIGGGGGAPNYIAAASRAQRELPQQMADATTNVNAGLAEQVRSGRLAGLQGILGVGGQQAGIGGNVAGIGQAESAAMLEAARANQGASLQASLANQDADLRAQQLTEQGYSADVAAKIAAAELGYRGLEGERSLYGTTPAMSSLFGSQALQGFGQRGQMEQFRNQYGLGLIDAQLRAMNGQPQEEQGRPWWQTALQVAGTVAPYVAMAASDRNLKEDISEPLDNERIMKGIKKLNLSTWKYKGDDVTHMGPMAQDVKKHLGIGDGKTLHLADIMGVMLATSKQAAEA